MRTFSYQPQDEVNSERVILIEVTSEEFGLGFGHIKARIVRRAKLIEFREDGSVKAWNDSDEIGFRNCSWSGSTKNAIYIEDLVIWNQFDVSEKDRAYGHTFSFKYVHDISSDEAKHLTKTFSTLNNGISKREDKFGRVKDISGYIRYIADILKIKTFIVGKEYKNVPLASKQHDEYTSTDVEFLVNKLQDSVR